MTAFKRKRYIPKMFQYIMKKLLFFISIVLIMASCTKKEQSVTNDGKRDVQELFTPSTTILLQPYGNFTQTEAEKLKADIEKHREDFGSVIIKDIKVLPNKPLTDDLLNDAKTRYRADKIIPKLQEQRGLGTNIIGLTRKDISLPHNGRKDWGVLGLAFMKSNACVVSTYRMKKMSDFWKVAAHEFCHAYYGAPHCPKDDPHCLLQDAKGKYTAARSKSLCDYCKSQL